jgi:hypothetical protein
MLDIASEFMLESARNYHSVAASKEFAGQMLVSQLALLHVVVVRVSRLWMSFEDTLVFRLALLFDGCDRDSSFNDVLQ